MLRLLEGRVLVGKAWKGRYLQVLMDLHGCQISVYQGSLILVYHLLFLRRNFEIVHRREVSITVRCMEGLDCMEEKE